MNFKFRKEKNLEQRIEEYKKVTNEHPGKIAIICEKDPKSSIKNLDKTKYLTDGDLTLPQFIATIRKKLDLNENDALFLLANGKNALSQNETMDIIYKKYKNKDGFLYFTYASEEVWG